MKYVRHKDDTVVIFSPGITHLDMANQLRWPKPLIHSAGHLAVREGRVWTGGNSADLGVDSAEDDTITLARLLGD